MHTAIFVIAAAVISGFAVWLVMRLTVIRKRDQQLKRAEEQAKAAAAAKSMFLANISHELLTPVNTISGMNEMAMRENATDVPKPYFLSMMNYCFDIRDASESLMALINDLLDIANIESGNLHPQEQEYDTGDMLRAIIGKVKQKCTDKELYFNIEVDELTPSRLFGDSERIVHIIKNLLSNSLKYTEKGGITLSVTMQGRVNRVCELSFSVKDTGRGMKPEEKAGLFAAFENLDKQLSSDSMSVTPGLDISYRFAVMMGGTLTCESEYGKGTKMVLTIKQKMIDQTPVGDLRLNEYVGRRGPYMPQFIAPDADILVVDNDRRSIGMIKGMLRQTNVFVSTAASTDECIDKIKDTPFHVVFVDQMMLKNNGAEVMARIRAAAPHMPVYVITANIAAGDTSYTEDGFSGYLLKPLDGVRLEKIIQRHISAQMKQVLSSGQDPEEPRDLPWDMRWIKETEGISVPDGIRNSGGVQTFVSALIMFRDTIDVNVEMIRNMYEKGDMNHLGIKVHSLGSSASIVGAGGLSSLAAELEAACKREDKGFIDENIDRLLSEYLSYKEKLARLHG